MQQQKTEGFLGKVYKTLFFNREDKNSADMEVSTARMLDRKDGIFGVSENRVFNFDAQSAGNKSIFQLQNEVEFLKRTMPTAKSGGAPKQVENKPDHDWLSLDFLKGLNLNEPVAPDDLGNRLDQIG